MSLLENKTACGLMARVGVLLLLGVNCTWAQLPVPKLNWVFPPGAVRGSTNLVTVAGSELDDPVELRFSDPTIHGVPVTGKPGDFTVTIPSNQPPALVEVRFSGRFGVSNPRVFAVGETAEFVVSPTNTAPASAVSLPLNTTASGRVSPSAISWFRFEARAGQRLFGRIQARELDSRLVPDLMVTDEAGRELVVARRRELIDFTAPATAPYLLRLNDQTFRGGEDFPFRLTLTAGPQLDFALPSFLEAGKTNRVALYGRNFPGGTPLPFLSPDRQPWEQFVVDVVAPAEGASGPSLLAPRRPAVAGMAWETFAWRWHGTNGDSNPWLFSLVTNGVFTAPPGGFAAVTPPCHASGLFSAGRELTGVTFDAKKGDVFWLETYADRLGFPADASALVQRELNEKDEHGESKYADLTSIEDTDANLGDREFTTTTRDASVRFEVPETGKYRVLLRDRFNAAPGRARYPWHLSIRPPLPDFRLAALALPPPKANNDDRQVHVAVPVLRRGQTLPLRIMVFRRDGFDGELELSATNLPPGVHAAITRVPAGQNAGTILLTADDSAAGATNATLLGRAAIGGTAVTHAASLAFVIWPVADYNNEIASSRLASESLISICEAESAPLTLLPAEAKTFEVTAGGKLSLPTKVIRRGDFPGAFNLKPAGHPELDKAKETSVAEKATNAVVELNLAETKLPEGIHTLWLQGTASGKYRNNPEALAVAEGLLKEAEKAVAAAPDKDKPALEERRKQAEAAKKSAEERAKPRDLTLLVYSEPFTVKVSPAPKPEEKK